MFQANSTFNALAKIKEITDLWDELGPRVWDFLQNSSQVNTIRVRFYTEMQHFLHYSLKLDQYHTIINMTLPPEEH